VIADIEVVVFSAVQEVGKVFDLVANTPQVRPTKYRLSVQWRNTIFVALRREQRRKQKPLARTILCQSANILWQAASKNLKRKAWIVNKTLY
jgi:hypothetical protein